MALKDPVKRKAYNKEYQKRWYEKNKKKRVQEVKEYKQQNTGKVRKWSRKHYWKDVEASRKYKRDQRFKEKYGELAGVARAVVNLEREVQNVRGTGNIHTRRNGRKVIGKNSNANHKRSKKR